jgi:hypothetical protein
MGGTKPFQGPGRRIGAVRVLASVFAGLCGLAVVAALATTLLPRQWLPWTPLSPDVPPGPFTAYRLDLLEHDPAGCRAFLREAGLVWQDVQDRRDGDFCAIEDALRLAPGSLGLTPNVPVMRCPVAAGLVLWRRHGLEPAAREIMGADLASIGHIGTYNCRRQRGNNSGLPSEHAFANAIDITGFTFANGRYARLPGDWNSEGDDARYLRAAWESACEVFKVTLGPEANAAHADHFHLDMGPFRSCR